MTNDELHELGLHAKGDQAKLRAFCRRQDGNIGGENDRASKMRKLKEIVQEGKSTRTSPKTSQEKATTSLSKKMKKPTLKFEFRWKHSADGNEYKLKRAQQGGGVRIKNILREAGPEACLKEAQDLFFPGGKNAEGSLEDLDVELGDFKDDIISMSDSFSAEVYRDTYGLHTPRLVLLTRKRKEMHTVSSSEDSDDEELMSPPWPTSPIKDPLSPNVSTGTSAMEASNEAEELIEQLPGDYQRSSLNQESIGESFLIGTSEERQELFNQVQRDYEASLAIDNARDQQLQVEKEVTAHKEELRMARERLTPPLPDTNDPHVIISVRHPDLGSVSRPFSSTSKMLDVYNWIGSLAPSPEHFFLARAFPRAYLYADEDVSSVGSSVLYMMKQEDPVPLTQCHTASDSSLPSTQQEMIESDIQIISDLPKQFMEEDTIPTYEEECAMELMKRLEVKRRTIQEELPLHEVMEVSRSNCLKDLLELYRESEIMYKKVPLLFKDEDATGEGVNREVYAVFWDNFVTHYCEGKFMVKIHHDCTI
jgi:hypothetical protein